MSISDAISITVTDMTGLNELIESKTLSVYPNPLDGGNLNISISSGKQGPDEVLLVIKDILGRVVYHEKEKFTDGIFSLPSEIFKEDGVYYLSLHFSDEVITEKIIVENKR